MQENNLMQSTLNYNWPHGKRKINGGKYCAFKAIKSGICSLLLKIFNKKQPIENLNKQKFIKLRLRLRVTHERGLEGA